MQLTAEKKYQLLLEVSHKIRQTLDLEEILSHLLDIIQSIVGYDAGGIFVLNRDIGGAHYVRPRTLIAGVARRGFDNVPPESDPMLSLGQGIVGHVIRTGQPVVAPDVHLDPHYVVGRRATRSEIAVPITRDGRAIGALNLESDQLGAFGEDDLEILRFFADAISTSIEKAVLHRRLLDQQRMQEQMHLAQEVQARLLPREAPRLPGYDIAGVCLPAFDVGGDYFDYVRLPGGRLGVAVADVSGKGVPAALIMSAFRALLRTHALAQAAPAHIMENLNQSLPEATALEDFVTCVYGVLDPGGQFAYANCGHNPPILVRADGRIEKLPRNGPVLGMFEDARYDSSQVHIGPGDLLVLYTDGVVDGIDDTGEDFGAARLAEAVRHASGQSAPDLIRQVIRETQIFSGAASYEDDFTLVVLRRGPTNGHAGA